MKILHVYARNLKIFEDALEGTGCHINGSKSLTYMRKSFTMFNARDTMGLVVFRSPMTKKTLKLVEYFDDMFLFTPMPVVIVSDQATALYSAKKIKLKNSKLFLVDSIEGTISDIDLRRIFATLSCVSDEMYDMSEIEERHRRTSVSGGPTVLETKSLADEVLATYKKLGGVTTHANKR